MNFLEKIGLLWVIYWFNQSAMHSSVYYTIDSIGAQGNARAALILSIPGIFLFLVGNHYKELIKDDATYKKKDNKNLKFCTKCGFENDKDFDFCANCGAINLKK